MQSFASNKGFKSGGVKCPPVIMGLKEVIKHQIVAVYMHTDPPAVQDLC